MGPRRPARFSRSFEYAPKPALTGSAPLRPSLCAEQLHLIVRWLREEVVWVFYGRYRWIVAQMAIKSGKPEQTRFMDHAAEGRTPEPFPIAGSVRLGCKNRNGSWRAGSCLMHPLREWVLCAPQMLAIEYEGLSVQVLGSTLGHDVGSTEA